MHSAEFAGQCPHLAAALEGSLVSLKSPKSPTGTLPGVTLLANWKFLQEYLHLWRLKLVDPSKIRDPHCHTCTSPQLGAPRLHLCLHCSKCFCMKGDHLAAHFEAFPDHFLAVDVKSDHLYCLRCESNIIHPQFDEISIHARHFAITQFQKMTRRPASVLEYEDWTPTANERTVLASHSLSGSFRGLRGLNNLGNTCFMNSVLQALVSNPMFSNYYLAEAHNRKTCFLSRSSRICLGCEADRLIDQMFSGDRVPFSPHRFLLQTWRCTDHLAGYEQQDAHDFYISTMNALHTHIGESLILEQEDRVRGLVETYARENENTFSLPPSKPLDLTLVPAEALKGVTLYANDAFSDEKCECVTHKCFAGFLRSDVTCLSCKAVSTVKEAFLDIPIDLEGLQSRDGNGLSLIDGLNHFTHAELLDAFHCARCASRSTCTKQLSIDQLPLTLCFHLKRFKHTLTSTRKIDSYMAFPFHLDMTPYTATQTSNETAQSPAPVEEKEETSSRRRRSNSRSNAANATSNAHNHSHNHTLDHSHLNPSIDSENFVPRGDLAVYSLYAVVNHSGNMENGHYTGFIRKGKDWFRCDDHFITKATKNEVAASRAYLLFYCRTVLEYQE